MRTPTFLLPPQYLSLPSAYPLCEAYIYQKDERELPGNFTSVLQPRNNINVEHLTPSPPPFSNLSSSYFVFSIERERLILISYYL